MAVTLPSLTLLSVETVLGNTSLFTIICLILLRAKLQFWFFVLSAALHPAYILLGLSSRSWHTVVKQLKHCLWSHSVIISLPPTIFYSYDTSYEEGREQEVALAAIDELLSKVTLLCGLPTRW